MIVTIRIGFVLILAVLFVVVHASTVTRCPDNEEYRECGSACQENCTHTPKYCTYQCIPGCFCKTGFVRATDDKSKCIPHSNCSCRANEFYNECGSACPDTCTDRSQLCTKQCIPGCFCKNGFIRLNNQTDSPCIPESECSNALCHDPNAEYTECGSTCPQTCDDERNPMLKFRVCPTVCRVGCFCKSNYVLGENGKCVKPETCCQMINGSYETCATVCPQSCTNKTSLYCFLPCVSGCFCDQDYTHKSNEINSPCVHKTTC
ncbi:unnamed protein product [Rotaria magnacalcarata]|uniref:TIL domain-containing protein n=2 Tax=Rotaria magnacalcarata TaxID=392030 RepID=A0A819C3M2_9BILA|nr:unnamed protein product [Rotaria magnacalcarata]CAF2024460.1 unnamed protein product [Rotaria magnacalcarata]CAF3812603.1 unnamed protein product [Rotaria magnacalcarata]CAF3981125.1 unnamed protein product [Rotaria magnacalcarata]